MNELEFRELVWEKGRELFRPMPWRDDPSPYRVLVSELMLQQTQVERVVPKFNAFVAAFPDVHTLAAATLADVLTMWSGLGYNRRAKFLHEAAKRIVGEWQGVIPDDTALLTTLPGIGPNTAGAIRCYGFNQPADFIETNIRTVYIHHFFDDQEAIADSDIIDVVKRTVDREHPRQWYWALMDYGSDLKRRGLGSIRRSTGYTKQSPLKGSVREIRGHILRLLTTGGLAEGDMRQQVTVDERFDRALAGLRQDGLVQETNGQLHLPL
ncbi:MAG: mutY [Candidatus Saccharibacteria bacterium]|nr:mutY [Candidatus Saccharibacteria bacterium]